MTYPVWGLGRGRGQSEFSVSQQLKLILGHMTRRAAPRSPQAHHFEATSLTGS